MFRRAWRRLLSLAVLGCALIGLLCGCEGDSGFPWGRVIGPSDPGVVVRVWDARSGEPLTEGVTGVVREGAFEDSLRSAGGNTLYGAAGRPGIYEVEIAKEGYQEWKASGVRVRRSGWHPISTNLRAELAPTVTVEFHVIGVLYTVCDSTSHTIVPEPGHARIVIAMLTSCDLSFDPGPWTLESDSLTIETNVRGSPRECRIPPVPCSGYVYTVDVMNLLPGRYHLKMIRVTRSPYDGRVIATGVTLEGDVDVP